MLQLILEVYQLQFHRFISECFVSNFVLFLNEVDGLRKFGLRRKFLWKLFFADREINRKNRKNWNPQKLIVDRCFYETRRILASPKGESKYKRRVEISHSIVLHTKAYNKGFIIQLSCKMEQWSAYKLSVSCVTN